MKKISILAATAIVALGVSVSSCDSKKNVKLTSAVDSVSYALGIANGNGFRESLKTAPGDPINVDVLLAAFEIAMKNDSSAMKMTPEQAGAYMQTYFTEVQNKANEESKAEGEKFLTENKAKDGVITTESGLQYKVITEGKGAKPTTTDKVKVHYKGTLLDGTEFDSSYKRNEPTEFRVDQVIPGWTEGLQIMPVGSKYIFWIPSDLAYGERGMGRDIKPNSTLVFEVELLDIVKDDNKK